MRLEFSFDKKAIKDNGYTLENIYSIIQREFRQANLPCVSDDDILAFEGTGDENDYSHMLVLMGRITRADWFLDIASSCVWKNNNGTQEDILKELLKNNQNP